MIGNKLGFWIAVGRVDLCLILGFWEGGIYKSCNH